MSVTRGVDTPGGKTAPPVIESIESGESMFYVDEAIRRTTFLPDGLRWHSGDPPTPEALPETTGFEADAERYLASLEEQPPFRGIYFRSGAEQDLDSGDDDLRFRLEWDLFKNGYFERKKELEKKGNQNELQILQVLNDVNQHRLNQRLDGIEFITRAVRYGRSEELSALLADIMRRRRVQLEKGYITRDDFDGIRFKFRQAELEKKLYANHRPAALDASLHRLLNCAEFAELIPLEQARQAAVEHAYPLKIQQNLMERARYARSWTDDLSLDVYVEQRDDFSNNRRSNVGFEVKIPIHWDSKRNGLIEKEKRLYEKQAAVLTRRIETNLEKLYDFFAFQQSRIRILLLELEKISLKKSYERSRAERALEDLDYTPERSLDRIRIEEIELRYKAVLARLKIYEILIKIAALTHAQYPHEVITGTQTYCPGR